MTRSYALYVNIETLYGRRTLKYTPDNSEPRRSGSQLTLPLGSATRNGQWQRIERDLSADLQQLEPDNTFERATGLYLKGSGQLDNLQSTAR